MARHKRGHRRPGMTLPVAVVAGFAPGLMVTFRDFQQYGLGGAVNTLSRAYIGYDPGAQKFDFGAMRYGTLPLLAGIMVHKFAGRLGINRAIARTGIPFIRI